MNVYLHRAELELSAGQPERAIADIEKALSIGRTGGDDTSLLLAAGEDHAQQAEGGL